MVVENTVVEDTGAEDTMDTDTGVDSSSEDTIPSGQGNDQVTNEEPDASADEIESDVDEKGVPWKNRFKETERKHNKLSQDHESLRSELENLKNVLSVQKPKEEPIDEETKLRNKLKDSGWQQETIDSIFEAAEVITSKRVAPFTDMVYGGALESVMEDVKKSDDTGMSMQYADEVKQELKMFQPQFWKTKGAQDVAIGIVLRRHYNKLKQDITEKGNKKLVSSATETQSNKSIKSDGVNDDEIRKFADKQNLDSSDPETRKEIRKIIAIKKKIGG
jgi:hypothetical protein